MKHGPIEAQLAAFVGKLLELSSVLMKHGPIEAQLVPRHGLGKRRRRLPCS